LLDLIQLLYVLHPDPESNRRAAAFLVGAVKRSFSLEGMRTVESQIPWLVLRMDPARAEATIALLARAEAEARDYQKSAFSTALERSRAAMRHLGKPVPPRGRPDPVKGTVLGNPSGRVSPRFD
jgi:hypothetical protein